MYSSVNIFGTIRAATDKPGVPMLDKMIYIDNEYKRLKQELETIDQKMTKLKQQGMTTARPYWMRRNDPDGKPDQLELTHSQNSDYCKQHGTRREYIGVKPEKIKEALARVDRQYRYSGLRDEYRKLHRKIEGIERQFKILEAITFESLPR